jgi:hypothetical protein
MLYERWLSIPVVQRRRGGFVTQGENYFTPSHLPSLSILFCVLSLTSVIWSTNSAPLFAVAILHHLRLPVAVTVAVFTSPARSSHPYSHLHA